MFSKKITIMALFLLLLPMLAACGPDAGQPAATATTGGGAADATATTGGTGAGDATATTGGTGTTDATATTGGGGTTGDVFRWRAFAEPEILDPAMMQETLSVDIGQNIYEGLTQFDPETLEIEPGLAESWEVSEDGSVYTFKINKDAKFSNGDPVTAEVFMYSWNRALTTPEAPYLFVMSDIKGADEVQASVASTDTTATKVTEASGIEVVDPQTLRVTLKGPSAYFLPQTAVWTYHVVNKNVVEQCPADQRSCFQESGKNKGAGTGPYYIESWDHNQRMMLKVNENYWRDDQKATVDVEIPIVADTSTAQAQFENGQLDVLDQPDPNDIRRMEGDSAFEDKLFSVGNARTVWIGFNVMKAPFGPIDDPKATALRQAVAMGIDREQLIELALQGTGKAVTTLMPEGEPGFKKIDIYPFDAEAAKAKLAEAGYPNCQGLNLTYTTRDREVEQAVATQIQAQFRDNLGCDIQVAVVPWADMLAARQAHEYDMFYGSWGHDYPDPQNWFYPLFHSSQIDTGNDPGYNNPEYDRLVDQANVLADPDSVEERYGLYNQAEEILVRDAPLVPLYQSERYWIVNSDKWQGYGTNNSFIYPFYLVKPAQ